MPWARYKRAFCVNDLAEMTPDSFDWAAGTVSTVKMVNRDSAVTRLAGGDLIKEPLELPAIVR